MQRVRILSYSLLYAVSLILVPISVLIFSHTLLYQKWITFRNYESPYYAQHEIIVMQQQLDNAVYGVSVINLPLTEREQIHVHDVADLTFSIAFISAIVLVLLSLLSDSRKDHFVFSSMYFRIAVTVWYMLPVFFIGGSFIVSFDQTFLYFHSIAFKNDAWLLYPSDILINVYPPEFFQDMILLLLTLSVVSYIVTIVLSYYLEKKYAIIQ